MSDLVAIIRTCVLVVGKRSSRSSTRSRPAIKRALDLTFDALTTPERLARAGAVRTDAPPAAGRRAPADQPAREQADADRVGRQTGPGVGQPVADHPRRGVAAHPRSRRSGRAQALNGEPLEPVLPATAEAQRNGDLGAGHVAVIRSFWHRLPDFVDIETRAKAEAQLARLAGEHRPDELAKLADKLTDCLNPDGDFTDLDRARRRGITIGKQDIDGMSPISGYLTPEARATIDAVFAKLAAPGMCNPADDEPCVSGTPSQAAIQGDTRSARPAQPRRPARRRPRPAGLRRPRSTQRTARHHHRHHHSARTRSRRRQSADRRRHPAADVRCDPAGLPRPPLPGHLRQGQSAGAVSHQTPGLTGPANCVVRQGPWLLLPRLHRARHLCEAHHCDPYATNPVTDVNDLTLACGPNHKLAEQGWTTRKNATATPNGSHHPTSTTANPAPTPTTTPKNSCETTTKTTTGHSSCRGTFGGHTVLP